MEPESRPIGYWLKHLDRLIEDSLGRVLAGHGMSRRHWQVMNVLYTRPASSQEVYEAVRPFWEPGADTHHDVLADLASRGWSEQDDDGRHRLSPLGQATYAEVAEKVHALRTATTRGITGEEYSAVLATLQRMAANIENAA